MTPEARYRSTVTAEAVRHMRDETGRSMMECKRDLQRRALCTILKESNCDPGVRFILRLLIEGQLK